MATVKLLREGDYIRRKDTGFDGAVDLYQVKGLGLDSVEDRSQVANIVEGQLGPNPSKWGLPLSAIRVKRFASDQAYVNVIWGRARNGGYFLPTTFSGSRTTGVNHPIPIFYRHPDNPQWQLKWDSMERKVTTFRWNTRIQESTLGAKRNEFRAFNGMLKDFSGMGLMRLVDGGHQRLASNEVRFELVFEQPQAVKPFAVGDLGNEIAVAALLLGQEYKILESQDPPQILPVGYTIRYTQMPNNAFSWMDFSR